MINAALKKIGRVQKIDSAALELQRRFAAIDPGRGARKELEEARTEMEAAEAAHKTIRTELEDLELKNKGLEQKMESEKKRLYSGGVYNAKDAEAIDREIQNLKTRRSANDDRILELWEEVEPAKKSADAARAKFEEAEKKLRDYEARYAAIQQEFEQKNAQLQEARNREAANCDPALLDKYDAMRKRRGGIGLSAVVEGVCTACQTAVPKKQIGDLKLGETLETCENCLRYIYLEDEQ